MAIQRLRMTNSVLLDTNGWLALLNTDDVDHSRAEAVWLTLIRRGARVILTD
jgi:predicted nucleic acid-binding protein